MPKKILIRLTAEQAALAEEVLRRTGAMHYSKMFLVALAELPKNRERIRELEGRVRELEKTQRAFEKVAAHFQAFKSGMEAIEAKQKAGDA